MKHNTNIYPTEYWKDTKSKVTFIEFNNENIDLPITAVKIYIIKNNKLLLANVNRGWDLPGGHIEKNEKPHEALLREVMEETGCKITNFISVGYLKIKKTIRDKTNSQYPDISCILIYACKNIEFNKNFDLSQFESKGCKFINFSNLKKYHHNWTKLKKRILEFSIYRINQN